MTSQSRRKHSACLFRMRENCLFRKLRRNVCSDSRSTLVTGGGQWRSCETLPQVETSVPNRAINRAVTVENFSRTPGSAPLPQEGISAMDTDMDSPTGLNCTMSVAPGPSNFSLTNWQRRRSSSDTIMDLDSGVDPETGERAQG